MIQMVIDTSIVRKQKGGKMCKYHKCNVHFLSLLAILIMLISSCKKNEYEAYGEPPSDPTKYSKAEQSLQKYYQIENLQRSLSEKYNKLITAENEFDRSITTYSLVLRSQNTPLNETIADPQLKGKLLALQKAVAYTMIVHKEIENINLAQIELSNIKEQVRLDITLLNSLDQESLDKLLTQMDVVINTVTPLASELVINPENIELPSLEQVWKKYVRSQ